MSNAPHGPAQLKVRSVTPQDALPRVGRPLLLMARVANTGAETATNLELSIGFNGSVVDASRRRTADRQGFDEETSVTWTIQSDHEGLEKVTMTANAPNRHPRIVSRSRVTGSRTTSIDRNTSQSTAGRWCSCSAPGRLPVARLPDSCGAEPPLAWDHHATAFGPVHADWCAGGS